MLVSQVECVLDVFDLREVVVANDDGDDIEARLAYSHILVHIEPCESECDCCEVCSRIER